MLRDGLYKVANEMPVYFQATQEELQKTAAESNQKIKENGYSARDLLKIAYLDVLAATDMLTTYRKNFEEAEDEMEKNASAAKRSYEETGYLRKIASYLADALSDEEKMEVLETAEMMDQDTLRYMKTAGYAEEKGRFRASVELFGTPNDLIKEAAYSLNVVSQNIDY